MPQYPYRIVKKRVPIKQIWSEIIHIKLLDNIENIVYNRIKDRGNKQKELLTMENLFIKSYLVVGFEDKTKMATLNKEFETELEARKFIDEAMKNNEYEVIVLREEESYIGNNDNLHISTSGVIGKFERIEA